VDVEDAININEELDLQDFDQILIEAAQEEEAMMNYYGVDMSEEQEVEEIEQLLDAVIYVKDSQEAEDEEKAEIEAVIEMLDEEDLVVEEEMDVVEQVVEVMEEVEEEHLEIHIDVEEEPLLEEYEEEDSIVEEEKEEEEENLVEEYEEDKEYDHSVYGIEGNYYYDVDDTDEYELEIEEYYQQQVDEYYDDDEDMEDLFAFIEGDKILDEETLTEIARRQENPAVTLKDFEGSE